MGARISARRSGNRVILDADGKKLGLTKKGALDLSEKLKREALKAGPNNWEDLARGFPNIWEDRR